MSTSEADVAVIGLGAIGSMALWRLAERKVAVQGYERFGIAHDRGAPAGQTRRFSVQGQRHPRVTPLVVAALGFWRELERHTERELLRQTGGVSPYTEGVDVEPRATGVAVVMRAGEQTCDRVVLAPGPWAGELVPGARQRVVPRRLVQAWYLARRPRDYHPDVCGVFERVGDLQAYGFPTLDGVTVKVGVKFGTHPEVPDLAHVDRSVDLTFASRVAAAVREFFPGLRPDPVSLQMGVEGFSPDGLPRLGLGTSDPRLVVAWGFSGSDFKFAPVMGEVAADFAELRSTGRDVSCLAPGRHLLEGSTSS